MKFYKELYLGESIEDADEIIKKIKLNKVIPEIYVLSLATIPGNLLDIIPEWELLQPGYPHRDVGIIGLAKGKEEAIELVRHIVSEAVNEYGKENIMQFFCKKWEGQAWT